MTATFPHLHLAAFLEQPNKTFLVSDLGIALGVSSSLQHSPTQLTTNVIIFHPILTIVFHTGTSKHPQNILRIFSLKNCSLVNDSLTEMSSSTQANKAEVWM